MKDSSSSKELPRVATGIRGLDDVLGGGFTPDRLYLIEGEPGSGKTTLALQFLLEGVAKGESALYVTLSETEEELRGVARSHGWSLEGLDISELASSQEQLRPEAQTRMFHPSEVELGETTKSVLDRVERTKPRRIVFDSLSELRLLAQNALRYRRQILALKQFFVGRRCTVVFLDDRTLETSDLQLHSIAHGVVRLEQLSPEFGAERRRLRVIKMRGMAFRGGFHDFTIRRGGLQVFPRLVAAEHDRAPESDRLSSGDSALDTLHGGGIDRGTSVLVVGPAGCGKSSIAVQYCVAAAERGEHTAIVQFDESATTLRARSRSLGQNVDRHIDAGRIHLHPVDPAELPPGEFAHLVRREVEEHDARVVVIDSLNGYLNAMPEERFLVIQLHEMLTYLGRKGVVTFLVMAQQGILGANMTSPVDASYLADSVILLRYYETEGELRRLISVVKNRTGAHEDTLRELRLGSSGIWVGEPLRHLRGLLTGTPTERASRPGTEGGDG
jgi:circadian clock protein KaiC